MITLGITTSSNKPEIALEVDNRYYRENFVDPEKIVENLAPLIKKIFHISKKNIKHLNLICIDIGPGKLTSVKVGITTAKTIAQVLNVPIVGISSIELISKNIENSNVISTIMMSNTSLAFAELNSKNDFSEEKLNYIELKEFKKLINNLTRKTILTGNSIPYLKGEVSNRLCILADSKFWYPNSITLCKIGKKEFLKNNFKNSIKPIYLINPQIGKK